MIQCMHSSALKTEVWPTVRQVNTWLRSLLLHVPVPGQYKLDSVISQLWLRHSSHQSLMMKKHDGLISMQLNIHEAITAIEQWCAMFPKCRPLRHEWFGAVPQMIFKTHYQHIDTSNFIHFIHIGILLQWTAQILYKVILIHLRLFPNEFIRGWCPLECQGTKGSMGHLEKDQRPQNAHHSYRKYIQLEVRFYFPVLPWTSWRAWISCTIFLPDAVASSCFKESISFPIALNQACRFSARAQLWNHRKNIKVERYTQFLHTLL